MSSDNNQKQIKQNKILNNRMKSTSSTKPSRYQSFYMKKLQTQTSLSNQLENGLEETTMIIEREVQKIQRGLYKRNAMYTKTLSKKSQIEQDLERSRSDLKSRLQQKMRKSHHNMLEYRQKSNSSLSSRLKAEHKKIQEIKRLQKTIYNQKHEKTKQLSISTQKFFQELKQKKNNKSQLISIETSYLLSNRKKQPLFSPISNKYFKKRESSHQKSHQNLQENPQLYFNRSKLTILRTSRQSILQKQQKKIEIQKLKQNSFLRDYVQKLQCIQATRKKVKFEKKIPQSTVAKFVNRQINEEDIEARKKFSKSYVKQAVSSKNSFSQLYKKKLHDKKEKKSFFLSQSIAQGDLILKDDFKQTSKFRLNKLIRDTQNQLARKQNFRYMEKYLTKKI